MNKIGFFRNRESIYFIVIIFLFIAGNLFFLTTSIWMPPGSDVTHLTKIGEVQRWSNRTVTIVRWDYCENTKMMEVELDITNSEFDGKNIYDFEAVEIGGTRLTVNKIIEEADWVILQLSGIPKRWSEVSLRIYPEGDYDGKLKLYTNIVNVNKVAAIETKDINGYRAGRFESEIAAYELEIEEKNSEIESLITENEHIDAEILRLEDSKTYQTEMQKADTDTKISDAKMKKGNNEENITELESEITELYNRIEMVKKQMQEVLGLD